MPEAIPLIIGLITAGQGIASAVGGGGEAKPAAVSGPTPADAEKTKQAQIASLSSKFPEIQAATGGSLSPEAWIRLSELLTGKAGEPGIGAAGQDILKMLSGGASVAVGGGGGSSSTGTAGLTPGGTYG